MLAGVVASGLFEGAALYISAATVPHYEDKAQAVDHLLSEWRRFFPPAMNMQKSLVLLGMGASGLAAWTQRDSDIMWPFAVAGACQATILAYTLSSLMPINRQLLPVGQVEAKGEEATRDMLVQWGRKHAMRTLLGGMAFGASILGVHMLLTRK